MAGDKKRLSQNPLALRTITDLAIGDTPSNALIPQADGVYTYKRFTMTPVGLIAPEDATIEEMLEIEAVLETLETAVQWNIGDWYNRAKQQGIWGRMYDLQPAGDVDYKYQTLADYAWVAAAVDFSIRNRKLSFSHHRLVAPLPHELQVLWLTYAASRAAKLKVSGLKEDMKRLANLTPGEQAAWLEWILPNPDARFIHVEELKPLALPESVKSARERLTKNAAFIANTWANAENLDVTTRETAIKIGQQQLAMVQEYLRRLGG